MPKFGPTVHQKHERRNLQSAPSGELIVLFQTSSLGTRGGRRGVGIGNGWNMDGAMMGGKGRDGGGRGK